MVGPSKAEALGEMPCRETCNDGKEPEGKTTGGAVTEYGLEMIPVTPKSRGGLVSAIWMPKRVLFPACIAKTLGSESKAEMKPEYTNLDKIAQREEATSSGLDVVMAGHGQSRHGRVPVV